MTTIEWTNETWNPVSGCNKISPGCAHCYAADIAKRFWGDRPFSDVQFHPGRLERPLKWRKPRKIFVNSMSDLFHESVFVKQLGSKPIASDGSLIKLKSSKGGDWDEWPEDLRVRQFPREVQR